ncbi:MAG: hypothetical protein IJU76_05125 [Desulfovibrionaceae bacterium]|nr:hypothetical protein [Desulfovibrionaceae bacterium]
MSYAIWHFGCVSSTLDVAYQLARDGRLEVWESVTATSQRSGRGQLRRDWISPPGNMYASVRLPFEDPFTTEYAGPAFGVLVAEAMQRLMYPVRIKWPNDLIVQVGDGYAKLGGILLEERGGILLAGIGINVRSYPGEGELRDDHVFPATSLLAWKNIAVDAENLWQTLVMYMISVYKERGTFSKDWEESLAKYILGDRVPASGIAS